MSKNCIEIPKENPFENCKLDREKYSTILTDIVRANSDGIVLSIDNPWGAGKTTFVRMWQQSLINTNFETIYFNAWENDFEDNPFVAIMAELKEYYKNETTEVLKSVMHKGSTIAKSIIPVVTKSLVKKYLGEDAADFSEEYTKSIINAFEKDIENYLNRKENIQGFKKELQQFIDQRENQLPVVFIIDELDRCRPNYAVRLLESIKHLFSVRKIVFVLSVDKVQLGHAICGVYGSDLIDSQEYLRRFIEVDYHLPLPSTRLFVRHLIQKYDINDFFKHRFRLSSNVINGDGEEFERYTIFLFTLKSLTLRQQDKIIRHVKISLNSFDVKAYVIPEMLMYLIYLRIFHLEFYKRIRTLEYSPQSLLEMNQKVMSNGHLNQDDNTKFKTKTEVLLLLMYNQYLDYPERINIDDFLNDESSTMVRSLFDKSERQANFRSFLYGEFNSYNRRTISIEYLINKIDLIEPFQDRPDYQ